MAKKGNRIQVGLSCEVCNSHNYVTQKNKLVTKESLRLKKYCKVCKKVTLHNEKKKLH